MSNTVNDFMFTHDLDKIWNEACDAALKIGVRPEYMDDNLPWVETYNIIIKNYNHPLIGYLKEKKIGGDVLHAQSLCYMLLISHIIPYNLLYNDLVNPVYEPEKQLHSLICMAFKQKLKEYGIE